MFVPHILSCYWSPYALRQIAALGSKELDVVRGTYAMSKVKSDQKPRYSLRCFVSSPFNKRLNSVHKLFVNVISPIVEEKTKTDSDYRHRYRLLYSRLDRAPFIFPTIQQNVLDGIRSSQMMIADISNSSNKKVSPNASVMHEIGFATAQGIPIFLIGEKGTANNLPANLKGSLVSEYNKNSLEDHKKSDFSKNLANTILEAIKSDGRIMPARDFQVLGYRLRRKSDLPFLIRNAKFRVYILTTNLEYIHSRLKKPLKYALRKNVKMKANKSFKIELLTMDPESVVTNARAKQLSKEVAEYRNRLRVSLEKMQKIANNYSPENVEIGTYVTLPSLIMFLIDDMVVWSVPFPSQQSRLVGHFACVHDAVTTQQFLSYFFSVKSQTENQNLL